MASIALLALSIAFIVVATARWQMHPFLALLAAGFGFGLLSGMPPAEVAAAVNAGFGGTLGAIGVVIVAGCLIGTGLQRSGGALRLAEGALRLTGERNVPAAMGLVGYVVSMPVFCDSGFALLSSLNKALARRAGVTLAAGATALSLGLYATHTMVPPTPGPVAAAGLLGADLGRVFAWGLPVSAFALLVGWLFSVRVAARVQIAAYRTGEEPPAAPSPAPTAAGPSLGGALLPLLAPLALILLRSVAELPGRPLGSGAGAGTLAFLGQPTVALLLGVALALRLPRGAGEGAGDWVAQAVRDAAPILVITGAGGAFGRVLQSSGMADGIGEALAGARLGVWLPFVLAAAIKTAQGSSTVAIVTTAGLVAPLLAPLGLDGESGRALAVVAIGAGSMVVSHANDSYFWVVTQFSNMDLKTGFRLQTLGTGVQGCAAAVAVWIGSWLV